MGAIPRRVRNTGVGQPVHVFVGQVPLATRAQEVIDDWLARHLRTLPFARADSAAHHFASAEKGNR
jgi:hypothetical protein